MDTDTINNTPLNGRNWVYIAQLTAGVAPALQGNNIARGGGTGDFSANGQRTTQNNFILDGVDNNVNVDDEQNGASFNVKPPPDALAEFKIDTSDYSAEFGHSAGAVLNVSIKSGTNQLHGDLWEYVRNTAFDAKDWNASTIPEYHQNQFGATLGLPLWKNKVFYFGDAEANRIDQASAGLFTVPTDTERTGDMTELFLTGSNNSGKSQPVGVFAPNTGGCLPLTTAGGAVPNPGGTTLTALNGTINAGPFGTVTCPGGVTTNVLNPGNPPLAGLAIGAPFPYEPTPPYTGNGSGDGQTDTVAQEVLQAYPHANFNSVSGAACSSATAGGCPLSNNYRLNLPKKDDTFQWDQRVDWNVSQADQMYARFSYTHEQFGFTPPLGPIIDGGNDVSDGFHGAGDFNLGKNFMYSETHLFNPKLVNEFRFGYNWGFFGFLQSNSHTPASVLIPGMGGVPFAGLPEPNGGLPEITFSGVGSPSAAGARHDVPSIERQNIYQILDNVTKVWRNHSFKFGIQLETIRTSFSQAQYPRNIYQAGQYTSEAGDAFSGGAVGSFLTDNILKTRISPGWNTSYYRWYKAGYAQDDWKVNAKLTVNLGVRYDYIEPESNNAGDVANFQATSEGVDVNGNATGSGILQASSLVQPLNVFPATYVNSLAQSNIQINYLNSKSLMNAQKTNFAPRIGFAYQIDPKTVVRAGFGMFFGAIELPGGAELTVNFPWSYTAIITNQFLGTYACYPSPESGASNNLSYCPSTGVGNTNSTFAGVGQPVTAPSPFPTSLEIGGSYYLSNGLSSYAGTPTINRMPYDIKTPYTMSYNLTFERQIGRNMIATLGYVGNVARHTWTGTDFGAPTFLENPDSNNQTSPFPSASGGFYASAYTGEQMYNSLQSKLEKRLSNGLSFLATYTWSRAMDDGSNAGIGGGPGSYRNDQIIPEKDEMTNAVFDVRHRVTVNGFYELPFGKGKKWAHQGGLVDEIVGGWQTSLTWQAQTGNPFSVYTGGGTFNGASNLANGPYAIRVGNPFAGGGTPPAANLDSASCPATVKNRTNWYNPCAFIDPLSGVSTAQMALLGQTPTPQNGPGIPWINNVIGGNSVPVTGINAAISYAGAKQNQIYGPGYERVNMSLFKNFHTWRAQYFQFRADAFNLLNHPSWGPIGDTSLDGTAGQITGIQSFQNNTPDARFFQLAGKYVF
jgi:hypothetical protein